MSWRLLAHFALLPVCVWALAELFSVSSAKAAMGVAVWLVAAVLVHDLLLVPVYSALDRAARPLLRGAAVNYVRVPAALSLLLLGVFWGTIGGAGEDAYHAVSGRSFDRYATRWLLATAVLFAVSAVTYLVRRGSARRARRDR